jgi:hypothetical protein
MTKAIMTDKNIPSRFWDIVSEHCVVLNAVTSPTTYNNIYGAVLFAEKALVVGRLQIAFDPNFFPLTDKSSDNPRFKFLHALLGRGSDALDAAQGVSF